MAKKLLKLSDYVKQQLNEDDNDMAATGQDVATTSEPTTPDTGAVEPTEQPNEEIGKVVYTVDAVDREDKLKDLLNYIMGIGNQKRSFEIVVAPGDDEIEKKFTWNGEATDKIKSVKAVKEGEEEGGESGQSGEPSTPPEDESAATGQ